MSEESASSARVELVAAILLGIAAILTAWAAYNAALTDGDALQGYTQSTTTRAESNFFFNQGNQLFTSDTATFLQYQLEVERGNADVAAVIRDNLFTQPLTDAVDAWEAMGDGPDVPATPLDPTIYQLEDYVRAEELDAEANQQFADAKQSDDAGDKFELAVVFFAVALFMAGIASLFKVPRLRVGLLVISAALLVPGIVAIIQGHSMA